MRSIRTARMNNLVLAVVTLIFCIVSFFPVYWMFVTSVNPRDTVYVYPPRLLPTRLSLAPYMNVLSQFPVMGWVLSTLVVSIGTSIGAVTLAALSAYGLSRFKFTGRWGVQILILATQMLPGTLIVIPLYLVYMRLGLLNNRLGLILAYMTFSLPFCVWMLKGFLETIPKELDEAAMIDGCTRVQALFRVILPITLPGLVTTTLFSFILGWDEFLMARILMTARDKWVVSVGMSSFYGEYGVFYDQVAAAALFVSLPVVVLFVLLQRYFLQGLTLGSVKG